MPTTNADVDDPDRFEPSYDVTSLEDELGLGFYASTAPGIGGTLRKRPQDFEVHEDSAPIAKAHEQGKYTLARVRARNWETNHLMREIANRLGISQRAIFFTGTKDKRAVTVQNLAIAAPEEKVADLAIRDVEVLETYRVDRAPKLGEHSGNAFRIKIRELKAPLDEATARASAVRKALLEQGGFPNFFGPQRFGSVRPNTHLVGREIVHGRIADAVWTYIAYPGRDDPPDVRAQRETLMQTRDVQAAIEAIPTRFDYEHDLLEHLDANPDDHAGALKQLPLNLTRLFVGAYQGWLFNRALTRRAREHHPGRAVEGDLLHPVDDDGTPDDDRSIPVMSRNLDRCRWATRRGKGFPTAFLPGYEPATIDGLQARIEREILQEEGLRHDDFRVLELPKLSSSGTRRAMWCPLDTMETETGEDEVGAFVEVAFFLPKGSYATCVLRELMKTDLANY